jgi:hypothetical protein
VTTTFTPWSAVSLQRMSQETIPALGEQHSSTFP